MHALWNDLRYAARKLAAASGFTAVAIITLALGMGATTAVFSIVDTVVIKPLPYPDGDRLVRVFTVGRDGNQRPMSYLDFADYRAQSRAVAEMSVIIPETENLTATGATPMQLNGAAVSADFFSLLRVPMLLGSGFAAGSDRAGSPETVVLSEGLWRSRFGGDPGVVGRAIDLGGKPVTVVGVAPRSVITPAGTDLWTAAVPSPDDLDPGNRGAHYMAGIGRLAAGATAAGADRELHAIGSRLASAYPQTDAEFTAGAGDMRALMVSRVKPALEMLLACVGCLLLLACANVANLLLVRAASREGEMAVRTALGAGAWRLLRQLLAESALLVAAGVALGTVLAWWAIALVKAAGPAGVPRLGQVHVDGRLLLFAGGVGVVTAALFGMVPAWHALRTDIAETLKGGGRGANVQRSSRRVRSILAIVELAAAVVLLTGAGLLTRSLMRLVQVDPGFSPDHVVTMAVSLPGQKYPWDRQERAFADGLIAAMQAVPGVQSAAVAFGRPLDPNAMRLTFDRDDQPPAPPGHPNVTDIRMVSADFFRALGVRILAGRSFSSQDRAGSPLVFVASQTFVKQYFPGENPIGKQITFGWTRDTAADGHQVRTAGEIVGVVPDLERSGPAVPPVPAIYADFEQIPVTDISLLVRSTADPRQVMNAGKAAIRTLDPDLPVFGVQTMDAALSQSVAEPRFYAVLLASFAGIALVLAGLGLYGVIAYSVSQRTRELGIRIALGAGQRRVVGMVLQQGAMLIAAGLVIGLALAAAGGKLLSAELFGVTPHDSVTFVTVPALLALVAIAATWVPARRAARVDPLVAMRDE